MARFLADSKNTPLNSPELGDRIIRQVRRTGVSSLPVQFNPVDWFSAKWTDRENGRPARHFKDEYRELFVRRGTSPYSYFINGDLYEVVCRVLLELDPIGLAETVDELEREGAFDRTSRDDARRWDLRAIVIRQGQPRFRRELLNAYGGRCAITGCDAAPALESAHINSYNGAATNSVTNGILLRAELHTLFDLDLIAIDPRDWHLRVSSQLRWTVYWDLDGRPLRIPDAPSARPNRDAIASRWQAFIEREGDGGQS
jgi:hypothetical protein